MASRTLSAPTHLLLSTLFAFAAVLCFSTMAQAGATPVSCTDLGGTEAGDDCLLDGDSFSCIDDSQIDIVGDFDVTNGSNIDCDGFNLIVNVGGNFTLDATSSMTADGTDGTDGGDGANGGSGSAGTSGTTGTGSDNGENGTQGGPGGNGNSPTSCTAGTAAGNITIVVEGTADVLGTLSAEGGDGGDGGAGGNGGPGGPGGSGGPAENGNGGQGAQGGSGGNGANGAQGCVCGDGGVVSVTSKSLLDSTIAGMINANGGDGGNGGSGGNGASGGPGGSGGASINGNGGNGAVGGSGGSGGNGGNARPGCAGGMIMIDQDLTIAGTAVITANGGDGGKQGAAGDGGDGGNGGTGGSGGASNTGAGGNGANGGSGDDGGNGGNGADGADGGMIAINASGDVTVELGATITALGGSGSFGGDAGEGGNGGAPGAAGGGNPAGSSGSFGSPGGDGNDGNDGNDATNATAKIDINHCDAASVVIETEINGVPASVEVTSEDVAQGVLSTFPPTIIDPDATITPDSELCKLCQIVLDKTIVGAPGKDPADDDDFCDNVTDPANPVCAGGENVGQACDPADDTPCRETDTTVGWIGEPVEFEFCVANTGTIGVTECMLGDTLVTGITDGPFSLMPGEEKCFTVGDTCSELISVPDTAMVTCQCGDSETDTRSAEDSADLECQAPGLEVMKDCRDTNVDTEFDFKITLNNTGTAPLRNCLIEDFIEPGDCPQMASEPPDLTRTIAVLSDIPPDGMRMTTFQNVTVEETSCNVVRATCEIVDEDTDECVPELIELPAGCESEGTPHPCCTGDGTGTECPAVVPSETDCKTITMTGNDECRVGRGCTTHTPGWWKNHPVQIAELGVLPVESCGFTLTTFKEITQDMCINNNEASANGTNMHQLQLIRQCAAANLNVAASLDGGGDCEKELPGLTFLLGFCCNGINDFAGICNNASGETVIADSLCIALLDFFNNRMDTLEDFGAMLSPGADPKECQRSSKDKIINPGRNLGPAAAASKKASSSDKDAEKAAKKAANEAKKAAEQAAKAAQ